MRQDTIPARLFRQAKLRPTAPAYYAKRDEDWRATSWRDYADAVRRAGKALMALGFPAGGKVSLLGFNRPEWVIFNLAAMSVGGVGAGVYTTCSAEEVQYIIHHAESLAVLLEDQRQWEKIQAQRENLPLLRHVIMMEGAPVIDDPMVMGWSEFLAHGNDVSDADFDDRIDALPLDGLATLIYTSGTTGPPKGVMLSHKNLAWTAQTTSELMNIRAVDSCLSYLPLSHIAEQMLSVHGPITTGTTVYFAESIDKVSDNLREVQPTVFFGVPRIWEKFYAGVSAKLEQVTGAKKMLVQWVRRVTTEVNRQRNRGQEPGLALKLQLRLADRLLLSKLKPAIGLGRARVCVSGAAPIAKEILEFFSSLDVIIYEVYGQSEDNGPTSLNVPGRAKFGTVGPPIPGTQVEIAEDGEIVVKGPHVFMGYYKDDEATAAALVDGWLQSGDLGAFDKEGFLSITGRKKDIIITAGGKNIAPKNIEAALKNSLLISEAVVIGDRRKFLTALITIDEDAAAQFILERGLSSGKSMDKYPELSQAVQEVVNSVNSLVAQVETIKRFRILPRSLTIDDGELTPTLKVKRNVVNERYHDLIEGMYAD